VFRTFGGEAIHHRVLLPAGYRRDALLDATDEVLHSLLVPPDAAEALRGGDVETFGRLRGQRLRAHLQQLVALLAVPAPGETERPPLSGVGG